MSEEAKMQKCILMLATSAFILAYGAATASAQQGPMMQPQAQTQQQQERPLQGAQTPRAGVEDYLDDDSGITGRHPGLGWRRYRDWGPGDAGFGMMRRGWMGEPGAMQSGMMMRMLFALMDSDGDGTVSLQEFQAAHERIFKAMDANKDGVLTLEEIQAFMRGTRTPAPRQ
jgi:hypothetical protein